MLAKAIPWPVRFTHCFVCDYTLPTPIGLCSVLRPLQHSIGRGDAQLQHSVTVCRINTITRILYYNQFVPLFIDNVLTMWPWRAASHQLFLPPVENNTSYYKSMYYFKSLCTILIQILQVLYFCLCLCVTTFNKWYSSQLSKPTLTGHSIRHCQ